VQGVIGGLIGVVVTGLFSLLVQRMGAKANVKIEALRTGVAAQGQEFVVLKEAMATLIRERDEARARVTELERERKRRGNP
jgi:hypothetical protein